MLGYFVLLLLFFLFFAASFAFGLREWLRPVADAPLSIDVDYVRVEHYFGVSFRAKMREWLETARALGTPRALDPPVHAVLEKTNGEAILVLSGGRFGEGKEHDQLAYSEGDLRLAAGSTFHREIYCRGCFRTESAVQLQSAAADGCLNLGPDNSVARWVDAERVVVLQRGTVVRSRVSSRESVRLDRQVAAQSVSAPVIRTAGYRPMTALLPADGRKSLPPVPPLGEGALSDLPPYLEGRRCSRLAPGTWVVHGDLTLTAGSHVACTLIVQGALRSGSDCVFAGDLKAGRIALGNRNHVLHNLVSEGSLDVGADSFLEKNVMAETDIRFSPGARVGRPGLPAVVSAGGDVILEENVAVAGKVAAGRWVRTI